MLTQAERERAATAASQDVRDQQVLERLDKIIALLTEIKNNTAPQSPAALQAN